MAGDRRKEKILMKCASPITGANGYTLSFNEIRESITGVFSYLDSIAIRTNRHLQDYERDTLESLCGSVNIPRVSKPMKYRPQWQERILLHQASDGAFEYLREITNDVYLINHIAVALDFETNTLFNANRIRAFIALHLFKPWHNNQEINMCCETDYSSRKRWVSKNIARYSDKPSKISGKPCCHVECRINGAQPIRREGISSFDDIVKLDHHGFWMKNLRLAEINQEKIGKRLIGHQKRKKPLIREYIPELPFNLYKRIGNGYLRAIESDVTYPLLCVQKFIDNSTFNARPYLITIPAEEFLEGIVRHNF